MFESEKRFFQKKLYKNPLILKDRSVGLAVGILKLVFIIGLCYLFLFPIFYMSSTALQGPEAANDPSVIWIPKAISLVSIKGVIDVLDYWKSIGLTATIAIGSTIASVISCSLVGYGFARFDFKEKKFAFALVLLTIIVPPQTILMSTYINYRFFDFSGLLSIFSGTSINLLNTPWTFILPSLFASGLRSGLFIFVFIQSFKGLPKDLEEAAAIDGCGPLPTYFKIMVPLAVPAFITVILFSFIWHWNDLYSSAMYFNEELRPITVRLSELSTLLQNAQIYSQDMSPFEIRSYMQAGALLTVLPPLVLYIFTQKYFTESIERTGIVG